MKYQIISADPPWSYRDKALAGKRGAGCKYDLLTDEELYALPVSEIAADDSVLFLWATMPKLKEGITCGERWGFTYKTVAFTWTKVYPNGNSFLGMGRWTRANAELVLLFTRGKPKRVNAGVRQVITTVPGKHSAKPLETRERIVQLIGDVPRIELFARSSGPGWTVLGNGIDGQDIRISLQEEIRRIQRP